ncbi:MAG: hypothetical protein R2849_09390 [Thermomicrobiales bacterium]
MLFGHNLARDWKEASDVPHEPENGIGRKWSCSPLVAKLLEYVIDEVGCLIFVMLKHPVLLSHRPQRCATESMTEITQERRCHE